MEFYHKSSCITCKKACKLLEDQGKAFSKRDFFKEEFSKEELEKIIKQSELSASEFLRKKDKTFKELQLDKKKLSDSELISLMIKYPGLIKRPIIISKNKVHIGKLG